MLLFPAFVFSAFVVDNATFLTIRRRREALNLVFSIVT